MNTIIRMFITAILVVIIANFMDGVSLQNGLKTSVYVAVVLSLLNFFVKPILIFFTFPITIITLGLFLLVINAIILMICSHFVSGFHIDGFFTALQFSIILSISQTILFKIIEDKK